MTISFLCILYSVLTATHQKKTFVFLRLVFFTNGNYLYLCALCWKQQYFILIAEKFLSVYTSYFKKSSPKWYTSGSILYFVFVIWTAVTIGTHIVLSNVDSFYLGKFLGMGWLSYMLHLFSDLWGLSIMSSAMVIVVYIPTKCGL